MSLRKYSKVILVAGSIQLLASCASVGPADSSSAYAVNNLAEVRVKENVHRLVDQGLDALKHNKLNSAEKYFKQAIGENETIVSPMLNLALIYTKQKRLLEAEAILRQALKRNSSIPQTYNLLGVVLRQQGRFLDAESAYKYALEIDENYANAQMNIAVLYDLYLLDYEQAKRHYRKYAALLPEEKQQVNAWMVDLQQRAQVSN
jgi:tetratricopeptide (TPR) repeat protein